jgi:hypothetical protein
MNNSSEGEFDSATKELISDLLSRITMRLNPKYTTLAPQEASKWTPEKKMYMSERCTVGEFKKLFPTAIYYPKRKLNLKTIPPGSRNKFVRTHKVAEIEFTSVRGLDYLFGPEWDITFNSKLVGFTLAPITIKLVTTEIFSHQTKLADNLSAFDVEWSLMHHHTSMNICFFRGAATRWGKYNPQTNTTSEANWRSIVDNLQSINIKLVRQRVKHNKIHRKQ